MTARRLRPPADPVTLTLDGRAIVADRGESLAQALLAADRLTLARSPKLHRPRGPYCLRGACDGCLVRVDGMPNVMACLTGADEGRRVETQNVFGTRTIDLLRMTDWFFPAGIDHHHLLAGVPGLSAVMQTFARRVAGLGLLPDEVRPTTPGARREIDVAVVGGGPAGIAAASVLAEAGLGVALIDDGLRIGGSLHAHGRAARDEALAGYALGRVELREHTTALGVYDGAVLAAGPAGAELFVARAIVLATGVHDGVLLFEGNDVPGVIAARAACRLLTEGVAIGSRVVVVGEGPYARRFVAEAPSLVAHHEPATAKLTRADGASRVGAVVFDEDGRSRRVRADALVIDAPGAPAFELCAQAGVAIEHLGPRGYGPSPSEGSETREQRRALAPGVWATGEVVGAEADPHALCREGAALAGAILDDFGRDHSPAPAPAPIEVRG